MSAETTRITPQFSNTISTSTYVYLISVIALGLLLHIYVFVNMFNRCNLLIRIYMIWILFCYIISNFECLGQIHFIKNYASQPSLIIAGFRYIW